MNVYCLLYILDSLKLLFLLVLQDLPVTLYLIMDVIDALLFIQAIE